MLTVEVLLRAVPLVRDAQGVLDQLIAAAYTDTLTGLLTRNAFRAITAGRAPDEPYGAVYFDLTDFKVINDAHSHDAGDAALSHFGGRLMATAKEYESIPFRLGGDEFALLVPAQRFRGLVTFLPELRQSPFQFEGVAITLTSSIGHAPPDGEATLEIVVQRAESAATASKAKGSVLPVEWTEALGAAEKRVQVRRRCIGGCEAGLTIHVAESRFHPNSLTKCPNCGEPY
jgi:diguanylate cyclase (GGDEF)-like protein